MAIPSGEIYLLRNVILNPSYDFTIDFKDPSEQFNYFRSFVKYELTKYTYQRREREYICVELPITETDDINYLMFRSAEDDRLYYAFVTTKTYNNTNSTFIYYAIDVMQTYAFNYEWRESYIKQSHVDRWTPDHKPIYSKTDEGLDYGSEYTVESAYRLEQSTELRWLLVTMTDYSELSDGGYETDVAYLSPIESSFVCALVPITINSNDKINYNGVTVNLKSAVIAGAPDAESYNIMSYMDIVRAMLYGALGPVIKSISLLTYNPFVASVRRDTEYRWHVDLNSAATYGLANIKHVEGMQFNDLLIVRSAPKELFNGALATANWDVGLTASLPTAAQWAEVKEKPYTTKRDKRYESKLLCAPYRYNLLTDWRNSPVIFKNEHLTTDKIEVKYSFALSFNAPFRYWIKDYKRDPEGRYTSLQQPLAPEMPVISDAYYTYMLQNKNTIQANLTNTIVGAIGSTASGAIPSAVTGATAGLAAGGPAGAVAGAVGGLIAGGTLQALNGAINVQGHIRSENAKQADLRAVPDTVINSVDSSFTLTDRCDALTFYRMRICCENENILAEIFNMTGYKVNRVAIPNTRSRTRFNYIQTAGANIVGSINQADLALIRQIYDKGVTIWHYNKDSFNPLDYSYENIEVNLI